MGETNKKLKEALRAKIEETTGATEGEEAGTDAGKKVGQIVGQAAGEAIGELLAGVEIEMNDKLLNLAYEKAKLKDLQGDRKVDSFGAEYDRIAEEKNDEITFEEAFES